MPFAMLFTVQVTAVSVVPVTEAVMPRVPFAVTLWVRLVGLEMGDPHRINGQAEALVVTSCGVLVSFTCTVKV